MNNDLVMNPNIVINYSPTKWKVYCDCYSNVTKADLMIPDYYCSTNPDYGYHCTSGMVCMQLNLSNVQRGFDGFDEFSKSTKYC